jgi:hypothetical protein
MYTNAAAVIQCIANTNKQHKQVKAITSTWELTMRMSATVSAITMSFYLAYVVVLGWSPVIRKLINRKRKSHSNVDSGENGGRAIANEEGISTLVFG